MTTINHPNATPGTATAVTADADRRDAVLAPVADTLLAAARIQPGESVLDLGCGH